MLDSLSLLAPTEHAPLAPSSASRWTHCPGSYAAEQAAPPGDTSYAAEQGTTAHALAAQCLANGVPATQVTADPSILSALTEALALARRIIADRPVLLETRLPALRGLPLLWGTCDVAVFDHCYRLAAIIDFKFGSYVVPADALQLAIYALLAGARFGITPAGVTTWIVQPRGLHLHGPARGAHYTASDLATVEQYVRAAAARTAAPDALRQAGEWCTFCRAAAVCATRRMARPKSKFFVEDSNA